MNRTFTRSANAPSAEIPLATVLAVGTELTTGQITNRNAAWISQKLVDLGIEVVLHETVADDRAQILDALNRCSQLAPLIFVTGGLGPTTDDFTRDVIAEWLNQPMQFHEPVWQAIVSRLTELKIPVAESNRQQCYFPLGAQILPNPSGTAAGFFATRTHSSNRTQIFVFPGPPRELAAVWEQGVEAQLKESFPHLNPTQLFKWQCMGKSEAELGELTEKTLLGSDLKTGYRAHMPYIEVKVWCPQEEVQAKQNWIHKLDDVLAPWTLCKDDEDLGKRLLRALERAEAIDIVDSASAGLLVQRLGKLLTEKDFEKLAEMITLSVEWSNFPNPEEYIQSVLEQADDESVTLTLSGFSNDGRGAIGLREGSRVFQESIQTPYRSERLIERMRAYLVEKAMQRWCEWLDTATT